jgi:hypothetical protein
MTMKELPEQLSGAESFSLSVRKITAFYVPRRFITVFRRGYHWPLSSSKLVRYFSFGFLRIRGLDSLVGIATGYGLDVRRGRSSSPGSLKNFLHVVRTGSGVHPISYTVGTGVKRRVSRSRKVELYLPPIFMAWFSFTFTLCKFLKTSLGFIYTMS